jgi:hypothetical protein
MLYNPGYTAGYTNIIKKEVLPISDDKQILPNKLIYKSIEYWQGALTTGWP